MTTTVTIPDINFAAFYYADILDALILYKRRNVEELTDESDYEPLIQLLRAFALVGHLNNTLLDLVANEGTLPTAKLVETVRNMLRLIGYEMSPAVPATVDLVYKLSRVLTIATEVVSDGAQAATKRDGDTAAIYFEANEALTCDPTDEFSWVLTEESGGFIDVTAAANDQTPGSTFATWVSPAVGDAIYFGHKHAMWDLLTIALDTIASDITGVWEFYDGDWSKVAPTAVVDLGGTLEFDLTSLLGSQNRSGTTVRVQLNETTAYEEVTSTWDGAKNIAVTGLLGQTSPSTSASDYTIGSDWTIIDDGTDGSSGLTASGELSYTLPQTVTSDWIEGEVNNKEAFWLRFRVVTIGGLPVAPIFDYALLTDGNQYVKRLATQGRTKSEVLGSSTGLANQSFTSQQAGFIWGTETVTVGGVPWVRVDNFLSSKPTDKHYITQLADEDKLVVVFSDGVSGKIPNAGVSNVEVEFRYGATDDGNVGARRVDTDKAGLVAVDSLWNPRPASGWTESEGSTEASLERAKINGPATLRIKDVALNADDAVTLAVAWDYLGASPVSRAKGIEEAYGPKTVGLVVVGGGGAQLSAAAIAALEEYFNGDPYASPPVAKHFVANQQVTVTNFTPHPIDVVAEVWGDVTAAEIEAGLRETFQPEALKADGVSYEWSFGDEVPHSRLEHEIFSVDETITKVLVTTPAGDTVLAANALPTIGTVTITVHQP